MGAKLRKVSRLKRFLPGLALLRETIMLSATVNVFRVHPETGAIDPEKPLSVSAETSDGLGVAARAKLRELYAKVRSLNEGPHGLVAYVEVRR